MVHEQVQLHNVHVPLIFFQAHAMHFFIKVEESILQGSRESPRPEIT
jgi:hypothetical protein